MPPLSLVKPKSQFEEIDTFFKNLDSSIHRVYTLPKVHIKLNAGNFGSAYKTDDNRVVKILKLNISNDLQYTISTLTNEISNYYNISQKCPQYFCEMLAYYYNPNIGEVAIIMKNCGIEMFDYLQIVSPKHNILREIFTKIAYALQCLHNNNFAHLDIKPENIAIEETLDDIVVKLIDAGSLTNTNQPRFTYGSDNYMAPEIRKAHLSTGMLDNTIDAKKSDIYSFGKMIEYVAPTLFTSKFLKTILSKIPGNRPSIQEIIKKLETPDTRTTSSPKSNDSRSNDSIEDYLGGTLKTRRTQIKKRSTRRRGIPFATK